MMTGDLFVAQNVFSTLLQQTITCCVDVDVKYM